ncbi:MAG: endospore germination permease [Thermoanaerobacteraceae bacterium]|nr:endospore germination permease [Thermoanaerobacteraceae bacterium]
MQTNNDNITPSQTTIFVISIIIGTGILSLPGNVSRVAGPDGWITVLLGGIASFLMAIPVAALSNKMDKSSFIGYMRSMFGPIVGSVFGTIYVVYFVFISSVILRIFADVLTTYIFVKTPEEFFIITMMLLTIYLILSGIEPTARTSEILVPISLFAIFFIHLIAIPNADFTELLPLLRTPLNKLLEGIYQTIFSFLGFEILLIVSPYITDRKHGFRIIGISLSVTTAVYLYIVIIVVSSLGLAKTSISIWPSMSLMMSISGPGRMLERMGILAMSIWIITMFTTLCGFYLAGSLTLSDLLYSKNYRLYIFILLPIIYILSLQPDNVLGVINWINVSSIIGILCSFVIPLLLLIMSSIKGRN